MNEKFRTKFIASRAVRGNLKEEEGCGAGACCNHLLAYKVQASTKKQTYFSYSII